MKFQDHAEGGVTVITLDNPPLNSLGHVLRSRIVAAIEVAEVDPAVRAIVLTGSPRAFSAGADVSEFGTPRQMAEPILRSVLERIRICTKPVVAALDGVALGGGLELALACHARVALGQARVGLPEITLGLIPGSGGTQRLPRLAGIDLALTLMQGGAPMAAAQLASTSLFDRVVDDGLIEAAADVARQLADAGAPWPHADRLNLDAEYVATKVSLARQRLNARQRLQPAYGALLDAIGASAGPIDAGLALERARFLGLIGTTEAQALRYQFKAERDSHRLPDTLQVEPRKVATVAVIGAGTMGAGIAICALDATLDVILLEQDETALARGRQRIADHYAGRVAAGKLGAAVADAAQARLTGTCDWQALARADVVIEAVFEELSVKQDVFRRLDAVARPGAVLATNTSYLDIDAIAAVTSRPQDVLGLHFFSPAQVMKLLEVIRGAHTSPDAMATAMTLGRTLRKVPVLCGNAFGFIGNRIYNAYRRQCEFMLEDGAWPEEVDQALTDFGFAMGPFAVADLSGLDIAWRMRRAQAATRDPRERHVPVLEQLCEQGRLGQKSGAGYYRYADGKRAQTTDDTVHDLIVQASAARGIQRRTLAPQEIQRRALLAMVNEAACLYADGVATRPSDIDVVLVQGYGFPRWQGGPVFWARQQDRERLGADLRCLVEAGGHGMRLADDTMLARLLD
ncbi:3-hydroxyacyl-CoA dehydrogenase NAD-binding [Leptothrix cholodnii SP-6]|uniref:3-hydroxyacyl-CoA dehydrogenase NAD-binding n=1 Tax=Leptothrix cholodnii (strain ATCC 51168 / LMG 8142 / SP-6) TaxID=395495 RepID=B1Y1T7_LEPCP|nr:3-hydroxyacyl-CoA dehydrogenase NAD-binding [Leptothrix cholodnii SP-6]